MKEYYARRAAEYDAISWEAFDEDERGAALLFGFLEGLVNQM